MKQLMLLCVCLLASLSLGCATVAYSGGPANAQYPPEKQSGERANQIVRNWDFELRQLQDDVDSVLMLRPGSRLSIWPQY